MEKLFEWIRNITYYLIFITVVGNLLPNKKYEKYIRFFAGMVLILLVLKPITGGLRLDDTLAYYFEAISLKKEAGELTGKISKMEEERLEQMLSKYEEAIGVDVKSMAETEGFECMNAKVNIDQDQDSATFGHVLGISMVLSENAENGEAEDGAIEVQNAEAVKNIEEVERIEITAETQKETENNETESGNKKKNEEKSSLTGIRKKIAEYYDLEEQDIEIQLEDGKG